MTDPRDDDALSWSGDDDPTLAVGPTSRSSADAPEQVGLPDGFTAVGRGSSEVGARREAANASTAEADAVAATGNVALISLGVLGGIYLIYTVGWIIGGIRLQSVAPLLLVSPAAYVPFFWLAVLAPAIWFLTSLLLSRGSAAWKRFAWLAAGAVLLIPWPFIMIGTVGQ